MFLASYKGGYSSIGIDVYDYVLYVRAHVCTYLIHMCGTLQSYHSDTAHPLVSASNAYI